MLWDWLAYYGPVLIITSINDFKGLTAPYLRYCLSFILVNLSNDFKDQFFHVKTIRTWLAYCRPKVTMTI